MVSLILSSDIRRYIRSTYGPYISDSQAVKYIYIQSFGFRPNWNMTFKHFD